MSKKEKQIFKIIINEFPNFDICEDIFDIGVEYFGGGMEHENQNNLEITKDYINAKICLDSVNLSRFVEIHYDKRTKKVYSSIYSMKRYKTSFKKNNRGF